jgi:glycosyltransferase involved in cell wall biosynthesis
MQRTPSVTVGIVALNRAWIIDKVLLSIQSQTYPHDSLFILFVDGESKDGTADLAKQKLSQSDFKGYEVIVQKCNIPEGRNICLESMRGDMLLFWDSDVIMEPGAVSKLVEALQTENADLMTSAVRQVTISSTDEIAGKLKEAVNLEKQAPCVEIKTATMGHSLLSKRLTSNVSFDTELTTQEDLDFCLRAREKGFKILLNPNVTVLDVNMFKVAYSDIYIGMSIKDGLRGVRKKSRAQVYAYDFSSGWRTSVHFLLSYKRYLFYVLYIPAIAITVYGVFTRNVFLFLVFPAYALLYTSVQIRRRGVARGLKAFVLSLLVGIPDAFWVTYYLIGSLLKNRKK